MGDKIVASVSTGLSFMCTAYHLYSSKSQLYSALNCSIIFFSGMLGFLALMKICRNTHNRSDGELLLLSSISSDHCEPAMLREVRVEASLYQDKKPPQQKILPSFWDKHGEKFYKLNMFSFFIIEGVLFGLTFSAADFFENYANMGHLALILTAFIGICITPRFRGDVAEICCTPINPNGGFDSTIFCGFLKMIGACLRYLAHCCSGCSCEGCTL